MPWNSINRVQECINLNSAVKEDELRFNPYSVKKD
jgi:hypothetical protein